MTNRLPTGAALVTGASRGIGRAIASRLARAGHDLVLTGRDETRLRELSDSLARTHDVAVHVVARDLGEEGAVDSIYRFAQENGITIDLLVNNAGLGAFGPFHESDPDRQAEIVDVNISAVVGLTRRFLPGMVERDRGRILNVASVVAYGPGPYMSVYYASKAFVLSFSEALAEELRNTDVRVTALCPGSVPTHFGERAGTAGLNLPRWGALDADTVAEIAYRSLRSGRRVVIPGRLNRIGVALGRWLPRRLVTRFVSRIMQPGLESDVDLRVRSRKSDDLE